VTKEYIIESLQTDPDDHSCRMK